ncbi:MAG: VOC family protein [Sphingomonas sp.]
MLQSIHHVAIIASDYARSRHFYVDLLGLPVIAETYREERRSWKCDLRIGDSQIELFSFPDPPPRPSRPEAAGLRHLSFGVGDLAQAVRMLAERGIETEPVRVDAMTGKQFTFFIDPDGLPLEIYEA